MFAKNGMNKRFTVVVHCQILASRRNKADLTPLTGDQMKRMFTLTKIPDFWVGNVRDLKVNCGHFNAKILLVVLLTCQKNDG